MILGRLKIKKKTIPSRMEGDEKLYFILHNLLSMTFFLVYSFGTELYQMQTQTLLDIFSANFGWFILKVFAISILFGLISRLLVYFGIWFYYEYRHRKQIKSFNIINKGINAMSYSYLMSILLSSVIFAIGGIVILQSMLFPNNNATTYILSYLLIKTIIIGLTWAKFK